MKYLLLIAALLCACGEPPKPKGKPECWMITSVHPHSGAAGTWYFLKLKNEDRRGYFDTSKWHPFEKGDTICVQHYEDGGVSLVEYRPQEGE